MTYDLLKGGALLALTLAIASPADAFRGGFGYGGGWHAGGFGAGGAWHAGGVTAGGTAWHAGGVAGEGWHGTAVNGWGGTWHADGWHAGGWYGGGWHGPTTVNAYYGGGCWGCAAAAVGAAAAATVAVGAMVATVPAGCPYQYAGGVTYYVCGGAWYRPYYGANGLYYQVVRPPL